MKGKLAKYVAAPALMFTGAYMGLRMLFPRVVGSLSGVSMLDLLGRTAVFHDVISYSFFAYYVGTENLTLFVWCLGFVVISVVAITVHYFGGWWKLINTVGDRLWR